MRAIVIDDSRAMRGILKRALTNLNYEVQEACNGAEGLGKLVGWTRPDLLLVDWNMPELNGIDFVRIVRQDGRYDHVKIMMVTTEIEMSQIETALAAGANEYLMKPFTEEGLRDKVQMLMSTQEAA